jgi:hypothetical protein
MLIELQNIYSIFKQRNVITKVGINHERPQREQLEEGLGLRYEPAEARGPVLILPGGLDLVGAEAGLTRVSSQCP